MKLSYYSCLGEHINYYGPFISLDESLNHYNDSNAIVLVLKGDTAYQVLGEAVLLNSKFIFKVIEPGEAVHIPEHHYAFFIHGKYQFPAKLDGDRLVTINTIAGEYPY